jgi:molecular chaperone DnaK
MNNAFERLQTASHKLAEVLYSQAGAAGQGGGETSGSSEQASSASAGAEGTTTGGDDNVIDAEYVDVDEEKK